MSLLILRERILLIMTMNLSLQLATGFAFTHIKVVFPNTDYKVLYTNKETEFLQVYDRGNCL